MIKDLSQHNLNQACADESAAGSIRRGDLPAGRQRRKTCLHPHLGGHLFIFGQFLVEFFIGFFGGPLKKNNLTFFGGHACPRWCPPLVHPATTPLQRRPRCQRPPCSQQTTTITLGMDSVAPKSFSNLVLQLLLLLHPELAVAIFKGEWHLKTLHCIAFCKWDNS